MKFVILFLLALSLEALASLPQDTNTGEKPLGPPTLGQPTYPTSGLPEASSANVTSEDTMSNLGNEPVNGSSTVQQQQEKPKDGNPFETGPYDKNGNYQIKIDEK